MYRLKYIHHQPGKHTTVAMHTPSLLDIQWNQNTVDRVNDAIPGIQVAGANDERVVQVRVIVHQTNSTAVRCTRRKGGIG